jgi:hypothetical protein
MTSRANPLDLNIAELDVLRDLRAGIHRLREDDPIWDALEQLGLVELAEAPFGGSARHMLTALGWRYRTE